MVVPQRDSDRSKISSRSIDELLEKFAVSQESGLDQQEAQRRLQHHGPNLLLKTRRRSSWRILATQFKSLIVGLLLAAAILSFAFNQWMEGIAIAAVILINTAIGFFTEVRAVRSMEALHRLSRVETTVRRSGETKEIPAEELVPGDIVLLAGGDVVTADSRLLDASRLQLDESTLTGESMPVDKQLEEGEETAPLAERSNMVFKGTSVTRGSGVGLVVATGMNTELGHISSLVEEAKEESTPLEKRLDQLARNLIWVTIVIALLVGIAGILTGKETFLMIESAIALAVAAIPEGLSVVATIALARGMWRMARRNALINRLSAVETLGATNTIFTDKTGTLTENLMTVDRVVVEWGEIKINQESEGDSPFTRGGEPVDPSQDESLREALVSAVLCNNASLQRGREGSERGVGDPIETALLAAGERAGFVKNELLKEKPRVHEEAFDSETKMMATFHREDDRYYVAVKGAPEAVLSASSMMLSSRGEVQMTEDARERWLAQNDKMAEEGLRILALAKKTASSTEISPYEELTFLGLAGLMDPPRRDVSKAVASCREAGIEVIMVTGDQPVTARNVGLAVGVVQRAEAQVIHGNDLAAPEGLSEERRRRIMGGRIFARVTPKQKLDLIAIHQEHGSVVAMTGDGVNDAPALKKADIGIAMGRRGTQVAREAADMVLKDDAFSTIVAAIEQGRVIFRNIRRFVFYLISCNVSEVMIISLASVVRAPLPILPLQILFLNLVTDVFPALALGVGEGDPGVMRQKPRDPKEPILARSHWLAIGGYGLLMTASVLTAFMASLALLKMGVKQAVTVSFLTLAFSQLWHVFNMRGRGSSFLRNDVVRNPFVWGAIAFCAGLLLAAVYVPGLSTVLKVEHPGRGGWTLILIMSIIPWGIGQILKWNGLRRA